MATQQVQHLLPHALDPYDDRTATWKVFLLAFLIASTLWFVLLLVLYKDQLATLTKHPVEVQLNGPAGETADVTLLADGTRMQTIVTLPAKFNVRVGSLTVNVQRREQKGTMTVLLKQGPGTPGAVATVAPGTGYARVQWEEGLLRMTTSGTGPSPYAD